MSQSAFSIYIYGFYLLAIGLILFLIPGLLMSVFSIVTADDLWVRLLGLFSVVVGIYYLYAAHNNLTAFFKISVVGRIIYVGGVIFLVIMNIAPSVLLLFEVFEMTGAMWTLYSLKKEKLV